LEPGKQQREQQLEHEALGVYEQLVTEVPDTGERRQGVIKQIMMPSEQIVCR
jgi:hypothetical protein